MGNNVYFKSFIAILVVGLLVLGAVILNRYKTEIVISKLSLNPTKTKTKNAYLRYVKSTVISNIGGHNILKFEMAIPYENMEQRRDLKR
ncbi:MAG: hypothetical protein V3S16_01000 [Candidatus Desulfatibia sp.]|uniref:hypothetical protein n=1 Tax=Candidatus Desulfatibia sp. TaxID=3101189 RepID=UPI002F2EDC11